LIDLAREVIAGPRKIGFLGIAMSPEGFSLLYSSWLPVRRAKGARETLRPAEIVTGIGDDPVVAFDWPRADLDAAAREFLIGLLSTACWRQIGEGWAAWWEEPPDAATLDACFAPFAHAFVLDGPGPRFLQDEAELESDAVGVGMLLMDMPGRGLFNRSHAIATMARGSAAISLFALQVFAPSGGRGHRTSLRGGGPLTTLLLPGPLTPGEPVPLWHQLWANVWWDDQWPDPADRPEAVFPWLGPTRVSDKGQTTTPEDVHPAQAFWGMPRRIRLDFEFNEEAAPCGLTGAVDRVIVRTYRTRPHGNNYAAWSRGHPLTPYYRKDSEWLPRQPRPERLGYRDWVGLVLADAAAAGATPAPAAAVVAAEHRLERMPPNVRHGTCLYAAGYDMDKMKPRGFVESEMPVRLVAEVVREDYEVVVRNLVFGAREAQGLLSGAIRTALWDREAPDASAGVRGLARERFWDETEGLFHSAVAALADALEATAADDDEAITTVMMSTRNGWREGLRRHVLAILDDLVPLDALEERDPERLVAARRNLVSGLSGCGKAGGLFYAALGLPPPEPKAKRRKAA
jgi:CRISPR system Cascade subunit CasA